MFRSRHANLLGFDTRARAPSRVHTTVTRRPPTPPLVYSRLAVRVWFSYERVRRLGNRTRFPAVRVPRSAYAARAAPRAYAEMASYASRILKAQMVWKRPVPLSEPGESLFWTICSVSSP